MSASAFPKEILEDFLAFSGQTSTQRPDDGENEGAFQCVGVLSTLGIDHSIEKPCELLDNVEICSGEGEVQRFVCLLPFNTLEYPRHQRRDVLWIQLIQRINQSLILLLRLRPPSHPLMPERLKSQIPRIHIDHATPRDGGRRGILQIGDLEQHLTEPLQPNPIPINQRQQLIIVHNGVHIFHPDSIHIPIIQDPAVLFFSWQGLLIGDSEGFG